MNVKYIFVNEDDLKLNLRDFICRNNESAIVYGYYASTELILMDIIPYILREDGIVWSVPISEVLVEEFINTFPESKYKGIRVQLMPMAGGPGRKGVKAAIEASIAVLSVKYPLIGLSYNMYKITADLIKDLSSYYEENNLTLKQQLDALINDNECVSKATIKDIMNFDEYHSIKFLESLGFYWDTNANCYRINEIDKAKARSIIEYLDDGDK